MIRLIIILIVTLVIGLFAGPLIQKIPGTVVLLLDEYSIQMRLWQLVVLVLIASLLFMFLYHLLARLAGSAGKFQRWTGSRRWQKARQRTIKGMIALAEGRWQKAEKLLTSAVADTDTSLINYLAAAQAAQAQKADDRRDNYLRLAHLAEPDAEIAVGLTQAQLQYSHGQYEEALASLTHLHRLAPTHGHVLLMLIRVYQKLSEWQAIIDLLPALKKSNQLSTDELTSFEEMAWVGVLQQSAQNQGAEGLQSIWANLSRKLRQNDNISYEYCKQLMLAGAGQEADKVLTQRIKKDKSEAFLQLYGQCETDDVARQLQFVEKLAEKFKHGHVWLITAGRLCLRLQIWGKARNYLEQAVAMKPTAEARKLLAMALDGLGEHQQAYQQFKAGWDQ